MDDRDTLRLNRLAAVQTFGRENRADFTAGSLALEHFANIDRIIVDLGHAKVGQLRTPVSKATRIEALRTDLKNVARTARSQGIKDAGFPVAAFAMPANTAERALLDHAVAVLARFEPDPKKDDPAAVAAKAALTARFIAYELPADFVEHLRADFDAIPKANEERRADNLENVENTEAINRLLREGNAEVVHLDAIMHNKYTRDSDKLRAWQSAAHVERVPQRQAKTGGTPAPDQPK